MTISETFLFRVKPAYSNTVREYKLPKTTSVADFIQYVKKVTAEDVLSTSSNNHHDMDRIVVVEAGQACTGDQEDAPEMEPSHYISMYEKYGDKLSLMTFYVRINMVRQ